MEFITDDRAELERQVRALGFDIVPTSYGYNIMDDFNTLEVSDTCYVETLHDIIKEYGNSLEV